ncbi:hypothetical protein ACIPW9_07485 [Streptomyces sp. NPDC090052]|uniref:hypothetical protein n=1 Tax=unclassified Streptomyces TaxID=2593676 RepID=UPI0022514BBA|nr:hypothetical protein [Streptomyces sp. NBC_01306]MCX4723871.1 hypothetical protein [Streptomyces sp. NBC_01306]WSV06576.1 hypothetical protein OG372_25040 [Streptomyces sp. NBC_01020]WSX44697.1 hypothetical protein OG760_25025 [Streptomyces sp. NBC_00963]
MDTFLDYLTVLAVFVILALPSLIWHARERRIDRQLAQRRGDPEPGAPAREPEGRALNRPAVRGRAARSEVMRGA